MPDRAGWPQWAVERAECATCGRYGYADQPAPPRLEASFDTWLQRFWPEGRSQVTKLGFFAWCSRQCESNWKAKRAEHLDRGQDGWAHMHNIEMDRRRLKSGVL